MTKKELSNEIYRISRLIDGAIGREISNSYFAKYLNGRCYIPDSFSNVSKSQLERLLLGLQTYSKSHNIKC